MEYGNKHLALSACAIGFSSLLVQVSLVRELLITLKGNELHIGLVACMWCAAAAAGSFGGALLREKIGETVLIPVLFAAAVVLTGASFICARYIRMFFPFRAYVPGAAESLFWACAVTVPVSFVFGCAMGAVLSGRRGREAVRYYLYETVGITAGGVLFSFLFTLFASVAHGIVFTLFVLASASTCLAVRRKRLMAVFIFLTAAVFCSVLASGAVNRADVLTRSGRYIEDERLISGYSSSTPYGDIDVTAYRGQTNVYHNGISAGYSGADRGTEEIGAIVNCIQPHGGDLLLVSATVSRIPQNIRRWGQWRIDALEIDPAVARTRNALGFPRVRIIEEDPVSYPEQAETDYDAVVVRVSLPSMLVLNRLYTLEYFRKLHSILKPGGTVFAVLDRPPDFAPGSYRDVMRSLYAAFSEPFQRRSVLVMDNYMIWMFTDGAIPAFRECRARFMDTMTDAVFVSPYGIEEAFTGESTVNWSSLLNQNRAEQNTIAAPRAVKHYLFYWMSVHGTMQKPVLPKPVWFYSAAFGTAVLLLGFCSLPGLRAGGMGMFAVMGITGLTGMAYEMCMAYLFQMKFGSLFSAIGFLFASFMVGSSAGTFHGKRIAEPNILHAVCIQAGLAVLCGVSGLLWKYAVLLYIVPFILNFLAGYCVGMEFTLFTRILSHRYSRAGGFLYGFDLAGGALGGILTGMYLIPHSDIASIFGWLTAVSIAAGAALVWYAGKYS